MSYDILLRQLHDEDGDVKQNAAWIVGQLCVKEAVPQLIELLNSDDTSSIRHVAAVALGRIRDSRASGELLRVLSDEDELVRSGCAIALGLLRSHQTLDALRAAMNSEKHPDVRREISAAVKAIATTSPRQRSAVEKKIEMTLDQLKQKPNDAQLHNNLGVAYFHNKQFDLSIKHCEKAKSLGAGVKWLEERLKPHRKSTGSRRRRSRRR